MVTNMGTSINGLSGHWQTVPTVYPRLVVHRDLQSMLMCGRSITSDTRQNVKLILVGLVIMMIVMSAILTVGS
jgi:hypothetical protein